MTHRRDALSGASLSSGVRVPRAATRMLAARRGPQGHNRARLCAGEEFSARAFVSTLTALRLRYVPSRPPPFGETKKFFTCPGILPGLEASSRQGRSQSRFMVDDVSHAISSDRRYEDTIACPRPCFWRRSRAKSFPAFLPVMRPDHSATGTPESLARAVILGLLFPVQIGGRYMGQRTSYVLWPPRILSDARCPQHACQGLSAPWTPTREGLPPLVWTLPAQARRGGVA
jgi:hypothetical protein